MLNNKRTQTMVVVVPISMASSEAFMAMEILPRPTLLARSCRRCAWARLMRSLAMVWIDALKRIVTQIDLLGCDVNRIAAAGATRYQSRLLKHATRQGTQGPRGHNIMSPAGVPMQREQTGAYRYVPVRRLGYPAYRSYEGRTWYR
jgi:hypothetical protein